jgi:hypothetical protein
MTNPLQHIYALEGPPFSGKTMLLNYLGEHHGCNFSVVPETGEYVGGDKNFPNIPFSNYEAAKANIHFFIALEKIRCQDAIKLYKKYGKPVIMDRSTPISSPIFYALLEEKHSVLHSFNDSFLQYALECFAKEIMRGGIFIPKGLIYLRPCDKNTFMARLPRGTRNMVFAHWNSFTYLDKKYQILLQSKFKDHSLQLVSKDDRCTIKKNVLKLTSFVDTPLPETYDLGLSVLNKFIGKTYKLDTGIDISVEQSKYKSSIARAISLVKQAKNSGLLNRHT